MKEHLLEWLLRFGTRDDVTWRYHLTDKGLEYINETG